MKGAEKKTWMLQLLPDIIVEDVCNLYELTARKINNNNNARTVEDDGGYDVDDDFFIGIMPHVPNLKSMSSTNAIRCAFHNSGGVCALENVEKIRNYIRSVTFSKSYTHCIYFTRHMLRNEYLCKNYFLLFSIAMNTTAAAMRVMTAATASSTHEQEFPSHTHVIFTQILPS